MATRIYGCIVEYGLATKELNYKINSHNQDTLNELSIVDEWPPLTRNMFAITNDVEEGTSLYTYSGRLIHFGANFKSIEYEWEEWKNKFEDLLCKLYWVEAEVHFVTEYAGVQTFEWRVDLKKWCIKDGLTPIKKEYWDFQGQIDWSK